jgi:hypothetical protein
VPGKIGKANGRTKDKRVGPRGCEPVFRADSPNWRGRKPRTRTNGVAWYKLGTGKNQRRRPMSVSCFGILCAPTVVCCEGLLMSSCKALLALVGGPGVPIESSNLPCRYLGPRRLGRRGTAAHRRSRFRSPDCRLR